MQEEGFKITERYAVYENYYKSVFEDKSLTCLFETYAFADDSELSGDAIELKKELLNILKTYSERQENEKNQYNRK